MMHKRRSYAVVEVDSAERLATMLTEHTWCPCNGFALGDLLFLNDSTSPDGAQEYAVFRAGRQIESITFSWCTWPKALGYIVELLNGGGVELKATVPVVQAPAEHGSCQHCA